MVISDWIHWIQQGLITLNHPCLHRFFPPQEQIKDLKTQIARRKCYKATNKMGVLTQFPPGKWGFSQEKCWMHGRMIDIWYNLIEWYSWGQPSLMFFDGEFLCKKKLVGMLWDDHQSWLATGTLYYWGWSVGSAEDSANWRCLIFGKRASFVADRTQQKFLTEWNWHHRTIN